MINIFDISTVIAALAAVIAAVFGFVMWRITRNQELSRLKALYQHLEFIEGSARGHENYISNAKLPIPSWPLPNMDLNFYLSHINYKVRKEFNLCCRMSTKNLKNSLIVVYERVNTINYLWKLKVEKPKIKTDYGLKYYQDLKRDIASCKEEIKKIVEIEGD